MGRRRASFVALALLLAACSSDSDSDPGSSGSAAPSTAASGGALAELPDPRTEVAGASWDGRIAVTGGLTADGKASSRLDLYVPETNRWEPGPPLPVALHHLGLAVLGDRLYAAGGYTNPPNGEWQAQARVLSLGPDDTSWRQETPMTRPRGALGLAAVGGRLVAAGGVTGEVTATTESWAPGEGAWRPGPDLAQAREHLAIASAGGRAYVIGGRVGGLDTNLRSVESWDGKEARWRAEPQLADSRGGTSASAVTNGTTGKVCVTGGEQPGGTIASVECLTPGGAGAWERAGALQVPRHGLAVAGVGANLHVIGGGPEPGLFVSGAHEVIATG